MRELDVSLVLSIIFSLVFQIFTYKCLLAKKTIKFSPITFLQLFILFCLIVFNNCFDTDVMKAPIGFLLILIANRVVFKDPYNITINTSVVSYAIAVVIEIILSILFIKIGKFEMSYLTQIDYLILLFSFLTNFISYLICRYVSFIKTFLSKVNEISTNLNYRKFLTVVFLIILLIIDFKNIDTSSIITYIVSLLLVILIFVIFVSYLNDEYKIKNELEKVDVLLDNITNYEKIIDDNRINSHEMLNNLILLKSVKNKNTKKYDKMLDDMIITYDKNGKGIKNISLLPKGLKGIIYFKINDLSDLSVSVNISKRLSDSIEKMNHEEFVILCKCTSILLDNAIDACKDTESKRLLIDIYKENDNIIISIENSCREEVEIELINTKYYSTKGKDRGLGLYIVKNLLTKSKIIFLEQENNNDCFISRLKIKKD